MRSVALLFGYLGLQVNIYAYDVTFDKLPVRAVYLQVGAFSHPASVQKIRARLRHFPLWVEHDGRMQRVFVVLPHDRAKQKATISRIKRIIPDAFIKHGFSPRITSPNWRDNSQAIDMTPLDSEAILKTRKKFF